MKTISILLIVTALSLIAGCGGVSGEKNFLTVNFQEAQTLRYEVVSSRNIAIDWGQMKKKSRNAENSIDRSFESLEMIMAYTPIENKRNGRMKIEAECELVKVKRSEKKSRRSNKKDAVEYLKGEKFVLTVNPSGKIEDYSQLDALIKKIGKKAFRAKSRRGRVKNPDMIGDFIASQWFLWDSLASIEKPAAGVVVGQQWTSKLSIPTPMVMRKARDVVYTLDEIRPTEEGQVAVISSQFTLSDSVPTTWPVPYTGSFQMSGAFGFLKSYKILDLQGKGTELYNIDTGITLQYQQRYTVQMEASLRLPLGTNPIITIEQNLTMRLLDK